MEIQIINRIYNELADEVSKETYISRCMYSMTSESRYIDDLVKKSTVYEYLCENCLLECAKKVIYGAGNWGKYLYGVFGENNVEVQCFIDKCAPGLIDNIRIVSPDEFILTSDGSEMIYVCLWNDADEIIEDLKMKGIRGENIIDVCKGSREKCANTQYFDLIDFEKLKNCNGAYIDCGCFDGTTSKIFIEKGFQPTKIYAFEPDSNNLEKCDDCLKELNVEYELINKGCWSEDGKLQFRQNEDSSSSGIVEDGNVTIEVAAIDSYVDEKVKFIKMDIEGAEYEALLGAQDIIKRDRPVLAICIYHKTDDLWKIPQLIKELNADYKLYVRHYWLNATETVLYAI